MNNYKEYTYQEVTDNDFIIIDNNVYNFKDFEKDHPGGSNVLVYFRGECD